MKNVHRYASIFFFLFALISPAAAQVPTATLVTIISAEDSRNYNADLERLLADKNADVRKRAALAAGRIGDDRAVEKLAALLKNDGSTDVREMAAFALGEIESAKAADAILEILSNLRENPKVLGRAVEAAGKIAAANAKADKATALGKAVIDVLAFESGRRSAPDIDVIRFGMTAVLRMRPVGAEEAVRPFLKYSDNALVADALNTLSRLRPKNSNEEVRDLLLEHKDAVVRANAARALGSAGDTSQDSLDVLLAAALEDADSRVRVSAIRSLAQLKDETSANALLKRGSDLLSAVQKNNAAPEMNELLELATALGTLLKDSKNDTAIKWLTTCRAVDQNRSPEFAAAFAKISPKKYFEEMKPGSLEFSDPWAAVAYAQGLEVLADSPDADMRLKAGLQLVEFVSDMATKVKKVDEGKMQMAMPDLLRALAKFQPENLDEILRSMIEDPDVFIRTAAAELLGERPVSKENMDALKKAAAKAMVTDKQYDDAQLAIMDAAFKLDKKEASGLLLTALNSPDYLVRKKAFDLLADADTAASPGIPTLIEHAREKNKDKVLPYSAIYGTKLGQVLNTKADYTRAASRKNGSVKAVVTTAKGTFTIDLLPEDAPLTVDNFIKLANAKYFNGLAVHRVVSNFVMQDGDPRGDGNGGPGWSIRCEINMVPYDRGAVGMALSGKDTGGSQWFATHSPQPHLDGGYTVFGKISEKDMKIVDNIVRGDKIISVRIIGK
jgi:cyclophilin family peptidyl-prolyl cis-trans isomerase/HEAT repeat protein